MNTQLRLMAPAQFAAYCEAAIANYAEENLRAGRVSREQALPQAEAAFAALLPQGLATPGQFLCEILVGAQGQDQQPEQASVVGWLWWALVESQGQRSAFVYDLMILPPARRRGHARAALRALEAEARDLGLAHIGLHVFAHNRGAQALYEALGFQTTGLNMRKGLAPG